MKRVGVAIVALLSTLACNERGETACANADYSQCGSPLPAQRPGGGPWPSYDEALADALQCTGAGLVVFRGECADGKQFITNAGTFGGGSYFYVNGSLVGVSSYTDVGGELCQCPFSSFLGTLEAVRCGQPMSEPLCGALRSQLFDPAFMDGVDCSCDDRPAAY